MRTNPFEENPDLEYEHYLALKMGRTVTELRRTVSNPEFVRWQIYHARRAQEMELQRKMSGG